MGTAEEGQRTLVRHARGIGNSEYGTNLSLYGLPTEEKGDPFYLKAWREAHPQTRQTTHDPWRCARQVWTTCGTICTQAATGLVISRYQPSRTLVDMEARWQRQDLEKVVVNETTLEQYQEVVLRSGHTWRLLWDDVRPGALRHTIVR